MVSTHFYCSFVELTICPFKCGPFKRRLYLTTFPRILEKGLNHVGFTVIFSANRSH